ncbi:cysteine desulfurase family protein [Paenibacillus filicis]|uniref:Cysteine desulfurase family protein n=1 Tax=Paenibacillus gyeongsangnamensis TaxID=3388067 RepID=A0ABT4Q2U1_9BACL|nr:cysteine desulfurase family protein [Paenibacillus filicis]MCZ8511196.1 cysteine desulfurase family protein [Paenibacillus filicis]
MIYMDNAATTPMDEEVIETMAEVMRRYYGNPSSLHRVGIDAELLVRRARETISEALGCRPEEIRFTSGGTESNNLAIRGAALRYRSRGNHLITTEIEHASVYEPFRKLESEGFKVTYLPVDASGAVSADAVRQALTDETIVVSVMHVNNETGRIQPVGEIGALLREYPKVVFHVDAVQGIGKLPVNPVRDGIDLMTCSPHKLHGPKGTGFLYCRSGVELEPLLLGGGQERGLRSGTENVPALVGMAKSVRKAVERQPQFMEHTTAIRERIVSCIAGIEELVLIGPKDAATGKMAPHIVHFAYPGMKSEVIVHALEQRGICVSTRSACSSGADKPSRVLQAMGLPRPVASSGIRISYTLQQSLEDADALCAALQDAVASLKPSAAEPNGRR